VEKLLKKNHIEISCEIRFNINYDQLFWGDERGTGEVTTIWMELLSLPCVLIGALIPSLKHHFWLGMLMLGWSFFKEEH